MTHPTDGHIRIPCPACRRGRLFSTAELLRFGSDQGAQALGLESWPEIEIDLGHSSLAGVERDAVPAALVAGCGADVVVG